MRREKNSNAQPQLDKIAQENEVQAAHLEKKVLSQVSLELQAENVRISRINHIFLVSAVFNIQR